MIETGLVATVRLEAMMQGVGGAVRVVWSISRRIPGLIEPGLDELGASAANGRMVPTTAVVGGHARQRRALAKGRRWPTTSRNSLTR